MLLLEQLERQTLADRHVAAVLMAAGAKDISLPTLHERREAFDEALTAEPTKNVPVVDDEQMELRRALGVT